MKNLEPFAGTAAVHEHDELLGHGWTVMAGKSGQGLWASPNCITPTLDTIPALIPAQGRLR